MGSFIDEHAQCDEVERVLTDAIPSWSRVTPYKHGHIWVYDPHYGWFRRRRRQRRPTASSAMRSNSAISGKHGVEGLSNYVNSPNTVVDCAVGHPFRVHCSV